MRSTFNAFAVSLICTALLFPGQSLQADVVWNEADNGDLSSSPAGPTEVNFANGTNTVIGSLSEPAGDLRDYLTFTIGPNQFLTSLTLDVFNADGAGFQAINSGDTGFIPGDDPSENFLGLEFTLLDFLGLDMLPFLAGGQYGSSGFAIPLGPGTYSYLIQEITPGQSTSYQLSFNVVPEPSSMGLFGLAGLLSTVRRRRR